MAFYLIVRGPLGAGKSTVARALGAALPAEVVSIDELLEAFEWDGGSEALFLAANASAARLARPRLDHGIPVIFDGNFYWRSAIDDLARRLRCPHAVYTLAVPLAQCIERDRARAHPYGEEATREVYAKVDRVRVGIDVDGRADVDHVVRVVRRSLRELGLDRDRGADTYYAM